jgi:hypothetical protein
MDYDLTSGLDDDTSRKYTTHSAGNELPKRRNRRRCVFFAPVHKCACCDPDYRRRNRLVVGERIDTIAIAIVTC